MALVPVVEVAQAGKDLRTAELYEKALDSQLFLPKVYQVKKLTGATTEFTHGRNYPPMFYYVDEAYDTWTWGGGYTYFNPPRYSFNTWRGINMDATKFRKSAEDWDSYVVLMLDPLSFPASHPSSTGHSGSPRLKVGENLEGTADYLADIDSKYQTLKVAQSEQFVCSLPQWITTPDWMNPASSLREDTFSFNHNLGYPPLYTPFGVNLVGLSIDMAYNGWSNIPTDFIVNQANDKWAEQWLAFASSVNMETLWIMVDKDKYYVRYRRYAQDWDNSTTFPARTIRVNYVLFDLSLTREFNLLS